MIGNQLGDLLTTKTSMCQKTSTHKKDTIANYGQGEILSRWIALVRHELGLAPGFGFQIQFEHIVKARLLRKIASTCDQNLATMSY